MLVYLNVGTMYRSSLKFLYVFVALIYLTQGSITKEEGKVLISRVETILSDISRFTEVKEAEVKKLLKEAEKLSGGVGISLEEKRMVLNAMGFKPGHWYACPNGHIYAIGDCGGAMVESQCPECHERIGGRNHSLIATNRVATEMDGSRHPAWSNAYNNMANFEL
ncbi:unnamed protein product [Notodromas monacha]|uniref:RZ-type domain-containing protein n=1 Tax=Notodromas monacha TaxID=399045 RepID=A0A7R9GG54_9CRUS|nr:unnamed protein product [Notodromas monacha]CAG0919616.1 unnamed protein product [Notodromas monacha]